MKEEQELFNKIGKENSFKVPEGYFEEFTSRLMETLPEKDKKVYHTTTWERVKPWIYMAAMFVGLMLSVRIFIDKQPDMEKQPTDGEHISELPDEYLDPIINQTMLDDYELYQYLTDAESPIYD